MISILLAVYNGEKYLSYSIESILKQTMTEWELLIGFNATSDGSKEIAYRYKDNRIKIFDYGLDKGKGKTLNKLIKEASYDWCGIQDDDDIWLPEKLMNQTKLINNYDVIGTLILYIDEQNQIFGYPPLATSHDDIKCQTLNGINQIANSSAIFKKNKVLDIGGWSETIDGVEDFDLWQRLLLSNNKFINVFEYLTLHRLHKNSNFNAKEHIAQQIC